MVVFISEIELQIHLGINSYKIRNLEILIDDTIISYSSLHLNIIKYNVNIIWEKEKLLKLTIKYNFGDIDEIYEIEMNMKLESKYFQKIFNDFIIKNGDLYIIK